MSTREGMHCLKKIYNHKYLIGSGVSNYGNLTINGYNVGEIRIRNYFQYRK